MWSHCYLTYDCIRTFHIVRVCVYTRTYMYVYTIGEPWLIQRIYMNHEGKLEIGRDKSVGSVIPKNWTQSHPHVCMCGQNQITTNIPNILERENMSRNGNSTKFWGQRILYHLPASTGCSTGFLAPVLCTLSTHPAQSQGQEENFGSRTETSDQYPESRGGDGNWGRQQPQTQLRFQLEEEEEQVEWTGVSLHFIWNI